MNETEPITPIAELITARMNAALEKHRGIEVVEPPPSPPDYLGKLRDAGYPKRQILNVGKMYGPGLKMAESLWPKIQAGDTLICLVGNRGPGKTQAATWWAWKRLQESKGAGIYVKCANLIGDIKSTWNNPKTIMTEDDVVERYRRAKYLVIDEFHERGASDWEARTLINLIDCRYDDMVATILIANLSIVEFERDINPSIISRANETGGVINCEWPSYRGIEPPK